MKKIILLILLASLQSQAEIKIVQTPFWMASYNDQQEVEIAPVQTGVIEDCKAYAEFIEEQSKQLTAEELEFYRSLPLAGQMKDNYEIDFRMKQVHRSIFQAKKAPGFPNFQVDNPVVEVDLLTLKDVKVLSKTGTFTDISKKMGLAETQIEPVKNNLNQVVAVKIKARDLVCDLISKNAVLSASAQHQISLNATDILAMNKFYSEVENKTFEVINGTDSNFIKAAMLGYSYSELFDGSKLSNEEIKKSISFLFSRLFKTNSLDLSENWMSFGNRYIINYQKSKQMGYGPVNLRMQAL